MPDLDPFITLSQCQEQIRLLTQDLKRYSTCLTQSEALADRLYQKLLLLEAQLRKGTDAGLD